MIIRKIVDRYLEPVADVPQHVVHYRPRLVVNVHNCFALEPLNGADECVNRRRGHAIGVGESTCGKELDFLAAKTPLE